MEEHWPSQTPAEAHPVPFTPPSDFAIEPELEGPTPRPLPAYLRQGRFETARRRIQLALILGALGCWALAAVPFVRELGKYIVPLEYLSWIGLACAGGCVFSCLKALLVLGPYRYVKEGLPLPARIVELVKAPTVLVHGQPSAHAFHAVVQYRHPETGELVTCRTKSNDFASFRKDDLATSFVVGDCVTAVYYPGKLERTLKLYGFLDLHPGLGIVSRQASSPPSSWWKVVGLFAAIIGFFFALFWNVYAYGKYCPLEFSPALAWPFGLGAVLLGGAMFAFLCRAGRSEQAKVRERNAAAEAAGEALEVAAAPVIQPKGVRGWGWTLLLGFGSLLLGGGTMLCWALSVNALLDRSPPQLWPAKVEEMVMKVHDGLFREYVIKYRLLGADQSHSFLTTPEHMESFATNWGVAEIHKGALGWRWVKEIRPFNRADGPLPAIPAGAAKGG